MNILVSGSKGLIGRQLIKQLKIVYPDAKIYELNRTIDLSNELSISLDLLTTDKSKCEEIFEKVKPKLFFHLAWNTDHKDYLTSVKNKLWEEVTINLIDAFYESGGYKFIGIGSSIEYDWSEKVPFSEYETSLNGNGWEYGKSKLNVYKYLQNKPDITFLWCRVFFVFGPGQDQSRLVPLLINNALYQGSSLKVNNSLSRDYISTFEISKQISVASMSSYCGAINICSGMSIQLKELIISIEMITKSKISLSEELFVDKFEVLDIYGCNKRISEISKGYKYTIENLVVDLERTISEMEK